MTEEVLHVYPSPPPEFSNKLRRFDSDLQLNWSPAHGCWSIWCKSGPDKFDHVMNIVDENGESMPLDDRVFYKLTRAKFYVNNPNALYQHLVTDPAYELEKAKEKAHAEVGYLANDRILKRRFEKAREIARRMSISDFQQTRPMYDENGKPYMELDYNTGELKPVMYKPHSSLK